MSEIVFIGTSDAFGSGGRRQSAILARGSRGSVLLDCGTTTNSGFSELALDRDEVDAIIVSHFHADHFAGIPLFVLAACYADRRTRPLQIAGPPRVEARVRTLAEAMGHPIDDASLPFSLHFSELPPGGLHEVGPARLSSFETNHQLEAHPHGYRVETGGQTIAYSGDTGWFAELPGHVAGADLFICECTFHSPVPTMDFHLSLEQLRDHKAEFDCGRMLITHLGAEMTERRGACDFETADDGLRVRL